MQASERRAPRSESAAGLRCASALDALAPCHARIVVAWEMASGAPSAMVTCNLRQLTIASNASGQCERRGNRSSRHELLAPEIDAHVQAFESVRAEQDRIAVVGKDDNRRRGSPAGVEQGETHFSLEDAAVGGLESVDSRGRYAKIDENVAWNPVVFAACVHHDVSEVAAAIGRSKRRGLPRSGEASAATLIVVLKIPVSSIIMAPGRSTWP